MKYYSGMEKEAFLAYVETHSDTPRALFNKEMVAQMMFLAGYKERAEEIFNDVRKWYSVDMRDLVVEARAKTELKIFGKVVNTKKMKKDSRSAPAKYLFMDELIEEISSKETVEEREMVVVENLRKKME